MVGGPVTVASPRKPSHQRWRPLQGTVSDVQPFWIWVQIAKSAEPKIQRLVQNDYLERYIRTLEQQRDMVTIRALLYRRRRISEVPNDSNRADYWLVWVDRIRAPRCAQLERVRGQSS